jgi:DNA-binding MarR family transcriptional regulator
MERPSDDLIHMSLDLSRLFRRTMQCGMGEANFLQLHALSIIGEHERLTMSAFANAMNISPSSATEFADRLLRSGFIQRITEPKNRRAVLLVLTPLGRKMIQGGIRRKGRLLGKLFAGLSTSDRAHLMRIFRLLLQKVQS